MKLSLMLPTVLAASGIFASVAAAAAKNADLEAPTTTTGLRANTATKQDARRTNRYWVAPVRNSGLTCIDNSIRAGGGKPNEICMTEGEALCIEYDYKPMGGRWQFGIKDSKLRLYNPKGEVVYEYCKDVTHLCIGEEHGFDPNRYSKERPYLTLYDEKVHEVVGSLTCDGTGGKDDENIGQSSILKLVDQADVGPYADYPLTLVKFKKGQTEDPDDNNSLWDITVTEPVATATGLQLESFLNYNADRCEWNSYVDSFEDLKRQVAAATDPDPDNRAKIEICEDRPIVFEDIIDFSNKYFEVSCLGDGCVFDLNSFSLVTPDGGSAFHAEFEGIAFENGSSFEGRDSPVYVNQWGGAFYLRGISLVDSTLVLKECTLRNNRAYDSGAIENGGANIIASDTLFIDNEAENDGGVLYSFNGASSFENCHFQQNKAGDDGGIIYSFDQSTFEGCFFEGNSADDNGAIEYTWSTSSFNACEFVSNYAGTDGGIAYTRGTSTYSRCRFEQNSAGDDAGVSYTLGDSSFSDCVFEDNTAGDNGGVVYTRPSGSSSFKRCRMFRNVATDDGGVAYSRGSSTFEDSTFQSNVAGDDAGVVYTGSDGDSSFKNCILSQNSADDNGGIAYNFGPSSFEDCDFEENSARDGGAIVSYERSSFIKCNFFGNSAIEEGGAIKLYRPRSSSFLTSDFLGNRAGVNGGAIFVDAQTITFEGCGFNENIANEVGGALMLMDATADIQACEFDKNSANEAGGAIFLEGGQSTANFDECKFIGNNAAFGGALLSFEGASTVLQRCSFQENSAFTGGAIYPFAAETSISATYFECNSANLGGAVYNEIGHIDVSNAEFTNNVARGGGAFVVDSANSTVDNCLFDQNTATEIGGGATAYLTSSSNVSAINTMNSIVFQNNTSLGPAQPSDDVLDVDSVFFGRGPQDIQCGVGFDNCFCDADFLDLPNISTNDPSSTCYDADVGTGPSPCSGCLSTPPSTCSAMPRAEATTRADSMSFQEMSNMTKDKMKSMGEKMATIKEKMSTVMAKTEREEMLGTDDEDENDLDSPNHHV